MRRIKIALLIFVFCCAVCLQFSEAQKNTTPAKTIDDTTLRGADARPADWLTHGRNYSETRFSPLTQVSAGNVKNLGLAWAFETQTTRGLEATPLVADGKVYISTKKKLVVLAAGRGKKLLSEVTLGSTAYATPVAANGSLYVCSQSYLWAVQKGAHEVLAPVAAGE